MGDLPNKEVITLQVDTFDLIRAGIAQIFAWHRVKEAVGGLGAQYRALVDLDVQAPDLALRPEEVCLLRSLSKPTSVGTICDQMNDPDFEVFRMLWAFHIMGLISREDEPR
jgi:hypothetical protein